MTRHPEVDRFLPLKPVHFLILVSLLEEDRYGYALVKDIEHRTDGGTRLEGGNLYRFIRKLLAQGLVTEAGERAVDETDERRIYYTLTALGRSVVKAETVRMKSLVRQVERGGRFGRVGGRA